MYINLVLFIRNVSAVSMAKTQEKACISLSVFYWLYVKRYLLSWGFVSWYSRNIPEILNVLNLELPLLMRE